MSNAELKRAFASQMTRRNLLSVGVLGASGVTLAGLLRARAKAALRQREMKETSVVWLWLQGGAPHIETFDPKRNAPSNYRSMVGSISTKLPGVEFGALLPRLSQAAGHLAVVRSFGHTNSDHLGASHYVLTAEDGPGGTRQQTKPSFGSIAAKVRGVSHPVTGVPTFIRLSRTISFDFDQPLWLGEANAPFDASGQTRNNLNLSVDSARLADRRSLLKGMDRLRREIDQSGVMDGLDSFEQQAVDMILGKSKQAFDVSQEDPQLRERYGPGLGEQLLTARRLCEAGCGFVSLTYAYAPSSSDTPFGWDMHLDPSQPGAQPMEGQLRAIFPMFDHAIAMFLEDLAQRGLSEKILLVITGDFGRTPKINQYGGRDHWPELSTLALAGGGLRMGQVVGTSSPKSEQPTSSPVAPKDLMATIFHVLGFDAELQFRDFSGRPQYLLPDGGKPISELI
jgi:hypothetical protein